MIKLTISFYKAGDYMIDNKKVIALCVSRVHEPINNKLIEFLNRRLILNNCTLFVYNVCYDLNWYSKNLLWHNNIKSAQVAVFDLIDTDITDVIIIMDDIIKDKPTIMNIIDKKGLTGIPVIVVDGKKYPNCINITFDYEKGFEQIVRHVIEFHKVRRPHFMAGFKNDYFSERRLDIFRKVIEENNIPFSWDMVSYGDYWFEHSFNACNRLIENGNIPEAIICANDMMAMGVCRSLMNHNIAVPDDVIVTGFDGIDEINMCSPAITSCAFLAKDMAEQIMQIILKSFRGEKLLENYVVPPSKLIISESCGCPKDNSFDSIGYFLNRFYRYTDQEKILSEVSSKIHTAETTHEAVTLWKNNTDYNLVCLINKGFLDDSYKDKQKPFESIMTVFTDKDKNQTDVYDFQRKDIIPDIKKFIDNKKPLIFTALEYLNEPFGYVCLSFDLCDYCQIPDIIFSLNHAIGGFKNIHYQTMLVEKMERIYMLDSLTGLYTRSGGFNLLNNLFRKAVDENLPVNTVLVDLDKLKYINDTFGHNAGDNAIYIMAEALKKCSPKNALCIRFGGDEMTSFFIGKCEPLKIKSDIYNYLKNYNEKFKKDYTVSASVGIYSTSVSDEMNFETLIKKADELMYLDKISKR